MRVGKYELSELLGKGGMGEVWKATDSALGRVVAVKLLQRTGREDLLRFRREASLTAKLNHPNIAQLFEFGENFIAMQFIDGAGIGDSPLKPRDRMRALVDAARAVQYAHEQGVLHRDLKPANILVDKSGRAFVLDFGLAREVRPDTTAMSVTGDVLGTPSFMAPEQALGQVHSVDARTDVYGLGATLYALLAGRPPHTGPTAYDVLSRVIQDDPAPPGGGRDLQTICLRALEKDPWRRYATAGEFADDLERWLRNEPIVARPASMLYRLGKRIRRQPVIWSLSALLLLAIVGGAWFGAAQLIDKARLAQAQAIVDEARAMQADVSAALYMREATLEPWFPVLDRIRGRLRDALAIDPESGQAWFWMGQTYQLTGEYDDAVGAFEEAVSRDASAHAWMELGRALIMRAFRGVLIASVPLEERLRHLSSEADRVAECFGRAGAAPGIDRDMLEAYRLYAARDVERMHRHIAEVRERYAAAPGVEQFDFLLGITSPSEEAIAHLTRAIEIRPGHFSALLMRASERERLGDREGAMRDCDQAIRVHPRFADAVMFRATLQEASGLFEAARADLDRAIAMEPDLAAAYTNRGNLRATMGDREGALADHTRAIELEDDFAAAYVNRSILLNEMGRPEEASADAERAMQLEPDLLEAYLARGNVFYDRGDYAAALAEAERAVGLNPDSFVARLNRGSARHAMGDLRGAMEDFDAALRIDETADLRRNRGIALRDSGDVERAEEEFTASLRLAEDTQLRLERGILYGTMGRLEESEADFAAVIAAWPDRGIGY